MDIELKISKLYCRALFRELTEEQYAVSVYDLHTIHTVAIDPQRAVTDSISDASRESQLFREGVSYARRLVTHYRAEERRNV